MILYALVARGNIVLAEYTIISGNFPTITRVILGKIPGQDGKMSYVYDQYVFHYIVENKLVYLCMCDDMVKRKIPFGFLDDIQQKFTMTYGDRAQTANAFAMNEEFANVLKKQMEFYNGPTADTFAEVNSKLDDVKNVMVQNIEMVLERGEKLELLVDKTEKLQTEAKRFERSSTKLKSVMFWKRIKLYLLIFIVVALIIWVITAIACDIDYHKCK